MQAEITKAGRNAGCLKVRLTASVFEIIRNFPGRKKIDGTDILFEMTRANIEYIKLHFPEAVWNFGNEAVDEIMNMIEAEAMQLQAKVAPKQKIEPPKDFVFKMQPLDFQLEDFMELRDRKAFGLFWEQGLGKTKFSLDVAAHKWSKGEIDALLIMAPNGVHAQWVLEQVPRHLPDWVPRKCVYWQPEDTKKFQKLVDDVYKLEDGLKIFAINQEALITNRGEKFVLRVLDKCLTFWIIDESGSIAKHTATRTKVADKLKDRAEARAILDGTPIGVGVEDLYSPLHWLNEKILGHSSFFTFRNRYCTVEQVYGAPAGVKEITGYKNVNEFQKRLHAHCSRRTAKDNLTLPERMYAFRYVEFTKEQKRMYKDLVDEMITQLDSGEIVTADQAIVRLIRLQQITCGFIKDEEGNVINLDNNRIDGAKGWVSQLNGKGVIWARFHQDIDNLQAALKDYKPVVWDGRTSTADRILAKETFLNDPSCQLFIANQGSAGTGLDGLQQVSHHMLYYSNSFKAKERWQSEARLYRMGQQGTVFVTDLAIRNSVDIKLFATLKKRKDTADMVLDTPISEILDPTRYGSKEEIFEFARGLLNDD